MAAPIASFKIRDVDADITVNRPMGFLSSVSTYEDARSSSEDRINHR